MVEMTCLNFATDLSVVQMVSVRRQRFIISRSCMEMELVLGSTESIHLSVYRLRQTQSSDSLA